MVVQVALKSAAKTRNIEYKPYKLPDDIQTLEQLICAFVDCEIDKYEKHEIRVLSQQDIDTMLTQGKVTFGFKYREDENIDRDQSKKVALEAFEDGLVVVFIDGTKIEDLKQSLELKEDAVVVLIRMTMLAGRRF